MDEMEYQVLLKRCLDLRVAFDDLIAETRALQEMREEFRRAARERAMFHRRTIALATLRLR